MLTGIDMYVGHRFIFSAVKASIPSTLGLQLWSIQKQIIPHTKACHPWSEITSSTVGVYDYGLILFHQIPHSEVGSLRKVRWCFCYAF
jgi:hypothetical protein